MSEVDVNESGKAGFDRSRHDVRCKLLDEVLIWHCDKCGRNRHAEDVGNALRKAEEQIAALQAEREGYREALDNIRDAVLNGRYQLEGMDVDSDITNAVLGIIDDHTPKAPTPPAGLTVNKSTGHGEYPPPEPTSGYREALDKLLTALRTDHGKGEAIDAAHAVLKRTPPAGLRWTSERPSKPGRYWYRYKVGLINHIFWNILHVNATGYIPEYSNYVTDAAYIDGEWAGPLQAPEG